MSDTIARSVYAADFDGNRHLVCQMDDIVCGLGHLPAGNLVVLGMFQKRLWQLSDGAAALHADLSSIAAGTIDDMIVDARGNSYVGDLGFDLFSGPKPGGLGRLLLVAPTARAESWPTVSISPTASPSPPTARGSWSRRAWAAV